MKNNLDRKREREGGWAAQERNGRPQSVQATASRTASPFTTLYLSEVIHVILLSISTQ